MGQEIDLDLSQGKKNIQCYKYTKKGHIKHECPQRQKDTVEEKNKGSDKIAHSRGRLR